MRTKRILHVTECYSTGVARAILGIVAATPEHEHHLLYTGFENPPEDAGFVGVARMPAGNRKRISSVRVATAQLAPDVVHLHSSWAGVYGRALRKLPAKVVYQPHCFAFEDLERPAWQRSVFKAAERVLGRNTDAIVAVSERERLLGAQVAPTAEVVFVPNKSDLPYISARPGPPATTPRVVMSGEIRSQKDPDFFAEVSSRSRATGLPYEFVWLGDGDVTQREKLERSGVRVTGWVTKDQVREELDSAAVYLHTAKYEGFPLSVLDAAARLVPLLVRRLPAFDGLGVTTFGDASGALELLSSFLEDDIGFGVAVSNTELLRSIFDPGNVRTAVQSVYEQGEQ